jgi:hypothetical protein
MRRAFVTRYRWILAATLAALVSAALGVGLLARQAPARAQEVLWLRQFGSAGHDAITSAVADEAGAVVVGWTSGALAGAGVSGPKDAFVRRYDPAGTVTWTSQFGTGGADVATAAAVGADGAVYVAGQFAGTGQPGATPFWAFVRKYDKDGNELWTQQFGAEGASATATAASVAVDGSGAVYAAGWVFGTLPGQTAGGQDDAFVRKYDADGNEVWTRQAGGPGHDLATTVAIDAVGDVYVASQSDQTSGDVGTSVVRKYGPDGTELWTHPIGAVNDVTIAVTVDGAGAVYQVGEAFPSERVHSHAQGNHRGVPFVRKYAADGTVAWTRQFGAAATDAIVKLAVDSAGTVYVVGHTSRGTRAGAPDLRSIAFVRTFGPDGIEGDNRRFAGARYATTTAVAASPTGELYAVGWTRGALPGMTASGPTDAFISKIRL